MTIRLNGSTSGYTEIDAAAVADNGVLTLPSGTGTIAKTTDQGLVHINTTTFSAVSSVSLDDVFTSTFNNYSMIISALSSVGAELNIRLRLAGTDAAGPTYIFQRLVAGSSTVTADRSTGQTAARVAFADTTTSYYHVNVYDPAIAIATMFRSSNAVSQTSATFQDVVTRHAATNAYDGLTLLGSTGTITGTIRVYGYKNGA